MTLPEPTEWEEPVGFTVPKFWSEMTRDRAYNAWVDRGGEMTPGMKCYVSRSQTFNGERWIDDDDN